MYIDVDKVLKDKNPQLYKWLPTFILSWLKRIIHQNEINDFLKNYKGSSSIEFAQSVLSLFDVNIAIHDEKNLPKTGRYIVVSNHPLGGLDGIALIATLGKYRKDLKFPVNDLLMYLKELNEVFIPINKHGKNSLQAVKELNAVFESDELIFYFPAGLCSRKQKGVICDTAWKKTIISKAKEYKRDIIPVFFNGENSRRFYNLAKWRKKLGIKINIEMLFLPDEMFRQKGKKFEMTFGEPISFETFNNSKNDKEWATWLKDQVYALRKK